MYEYCHQTKGEDTFRVIFWMDWEPQHHESYLTEISKSGGWGKTQRLQILHSPLIFFMFAQKMCKFWERLPFRKDLLVDLKHNFWQIPETPVFVSLQTWDYLVLLVQYVRQCPVTLAQCRKTNYFFKSILLYLKEIV